jgi:[NiFe] hydrogenase diaphorase moiety large subunit
MAKEAKEISKITSEFNNDKTRLMDILLAVQKKQGFISDEAVEEIAQNLKVSTSEVEETLTFYHFFTKEPKGKYTIYLNESIMAQLAKREEVVEAFDKLGVKEGEVTEDGLIGLFPTACIGMSDQEPAALINGKFFTELNPEKVEKLVKWMKDGKEVEEMVEEFGYGDGQNSHELIKSMVNNNVKKQGEVLFADYEKGKSVKQALEMKPEEIVEIMKESSLRGRGGAGFPTGMKWEFAIKAKGDEKYVMANADEGEPGTFKERVLLTELPHLLIEGMIIAGYTIKAKEGIIYLRYEYQYLKEYLESILQEYKDEGLLGEDIQGKGFDYDIRVQLGAGAYVCGEESALIESAEGKRGEPRNRPPFPVQVGYLDKPTVVNNVETFSCVTQIIDKGADWFKKYGTAETPGTKLLSISGDCEKPGIYEVEWGITVKEMLEMAGADLSNTQAVQVGGPSGNCISPKQFDRKIAFEDLGTGGSIMIFDNSRDLLGEIVPNFMRFFLDESCGSCSTCRWMTNAIFKKYMKIVEGNGVKTDIDEIKYWCEMMWSVNRCGLGKTSTNPIYRTIENFFEKYEKLLKKGDYKSKFDPKKALKPAAEATGRESEIKHLAKEIA